MSLKALIVFLSMMVSFHCVTYSQNYIQREVVYLNDGSAIRGSVNYNKSRDTVFVKIALVNRVEAIPKSNIKEIKKELFIRFAVLKRTKPGNPEVYKGRAVFYDLLLLKNYSLLRGKVLQVIGSDSIVIQEEANSKVSKHHRRDIANRYFEEIHSENKGKTSKRNKGDVANRDSEEIHSEDEETDGKAITTSVPDSLVAQEMKSLKCSYVGLSFGVAAPRGNFGRDDFGLQFKAREGEINELCYAETGWALGFEGAFMFHPKVPIGLATSLKVLHNAFDHVAASSDFEYLDFNGNNLRAEVSENTYLTVQMMVGVALAVPLNEKKSVIFDARAMTGIGGNSYLKPFVVKTNSSSSTYNYQNELTPCFGLDAGFRFKAPKGFTFGMRMGYTSLVLQDVRTNNATSGARYPQPTRYDLNANNLIFELLLGYTY